MDIGRSMAERIIEQARSDSGLHSSRSDQNDHLSIKNADGTVIGHMYPDGMIKGTNEGGSGALRWLQKR